MLRTFITFRWVTDLQNSACIVSYYEAASSDLAWKIQAERKTWGPLLRVMLHQVVGEIALSFQTGEGAATFVACLVMLKFAEVSPDISFVLRFSVVGEDAHSFYCRQR